MRYARKIEQRFYVLLLFKMLVMFVPGLGIFPKYCLTMRQERKIEQKFFVLLMFKLKKSTTPTSNEEDIHITRDDPDVTFDSELNTDDGEMDVLRNTTNTQDAFIFCPILGSISLDKTLEDKNLKQKTQVGANCKQRKMIWKTRKNGYTTKSPWLQCFIYDDICNNFLAHANLKLLS